MKKQPVWRRYSRLFGPNVRSDTDDELSFHLEMRVRDYMRQGMDEAAARRAAQARLGDVYSVREECAELGEQWRRDDRRREWFGEIVQDVKYGCRVLLRSPLFALVAVFTLALGVGATTAIFSVVNQVLLKPLPYDEPARLVNVWEHSPRGDDHNVASTGNYVDWTRRARSFTALGARWGSYGMTLTGAGEPRQVIVSSLTASTMRLLNVAPLLGRWLTDQDEQSGVHSVVLSHGMWQQQFGGDRGMLGKQLVLNDVSYQIVGVMPAGFLFPNAEVQVWLPISVDLMDATERRSHNLYVIGRLKHGVTVGAAQAEMTALARVLAVEHPQFMTGWDVNVAAQHEDLTTEVQPLLLVLLATVIVVLLIACGNLANLLMARAVVREGEFALRGALGAGRARMVRQLLTESLVIGVSGGAIGVLFAMIMMRIFLAAAPDSIPLVQQTTIDWRVLSFAALVSLLSTFLFGLTPALRAARSDLQSVLRAGRGAGRHLVRVRGTLLVAEVTLSVVLLVAAGLLVRSFLQLQRSDFGYDVKNVALMDIALPHARYPDNPQHIDFYERLLRRLESVPGVRSVAATSRAPGDPNETTFSFGIEGRPSRNPSGREDSEELHVITPAYFQTMGVNVRGRSFQDRDRADAIQVVIINEALARKHWPDEDPLGKRIAFRPGESPWLEIVGVASDTRMSSPEAEPSPALYIPQAQKTWSWLAGFTVVARFAPGVEAKELRARFQAALWELDDQLPVYRFDTVRERYSERIAGRSFAMNLVLLFAVVALVLSVVGLYGLMAYTVAQQRQEFGVRLALGARPIDIIRRVLRRSLGLATAGLVLGLALSLLTTRFLESLLYAVSPTDAPTLVTISALIVFTAAIASWAPAYRAVRSNPLNALKGS
jgi:putative ABC transport system permease protein